ncbi:Protein white [Nymphon striatum]|nr:Protein white [Nymphon striatum]
MARGDITNSSSTVWTDHPSPMDRLVQSAKKINDRFTTSVNSFLVSGRADAGEILAIMGPSGAGKTTLLNVLTQRNIANLQVSGSVCANDQPIGKSLISLSAYVQQDDLMFPTLTVREHLRFQARLRMDQKYTYDEKINRVEEVIKEFGLRKCADTIIGQTTLSGSFKGISGGQKKRLAIASEYLTNPLLMFLDEPTSGLDSFMAESVLRTLKTLANRGKTVIFTIHQPSSEIFDLIDKLLLVSEGRLVFLGTRPEAHEFFSSLSNSNQNYFSHDLNCPNHHNPADFFVHSIAIKPENEENCRLQIKKISDSFEISSLNTYETKDSIIPNAKKTEDSEAKSMYKANWITQFSMLLERYLLSIKRNLFISVVSIGQCMIPLFIIQPSVYGTIVYFMSGLNPDPIRFVTYIGTCLLMSNISISVDCNAISCLSGETIIKNLSYSEGTIDHKKPSYFERGVHSVEGTIELSWHNINVYAQPASGLCSRQKKPKIQILQDVSGRALPGEILAIMGASGAGKTTLLNVLTQRNKGDLEVSGSVFANGQPTGKSLISLSAYVQQDDLMFPNLTVREHLKFQARLRMSQRYTYKEKMQRVEEVINEFGLSKCADTIIGETSLAATTKGISGGQKKRLAIASEYLTNPLLMFLDEPTSGLDSFMAESVLRTLKTLASTGKTVICTIHQPSSEIFELIDKHGLKCPIHYNPADFFVHSMAIKPGDEENCKLRVKVLSVIVGLLYLNTAYDTKGSQNFNGIIFLTLIQCTFPYIFPVINTFTPELGIYRREHWNGMYRSDTYFLSKVFAELPLYVVRPAIFGTIVYWMSGMNPDPIRFAIFIAVCILVANTSLSAGYIMSCACSSIQIALAVTPPLILPLLLFGGIFLNSGSIPVYFVWLKYLSWFNYAYEIMIVNQWSNIGNLTDCNAKACLTGEILIENLSYSQDNVTFDFSMLAGLLVGYRIIAYIILALKSRKKE